MSDIGHLPCVDARNGAASRRRPRASFRRERARPKISLRRGNSHDFRLLWLSAGGAVTADRDTATPVGNRLLGLLEIPDYERLRPHFERIPLRYKKSLYNAQEPIDFVYFIETGVGSLVNTMANGQAAEVGTVGNEGVVGLPLLFEDERAPTSVYVQVPGSGLRMRAALFKLELAQSASMRTVMLHYAHAFFNQVAQSAACNHFHNLQQRCCRWLLMTHDRMQSDQFLLTQEFLAMMLGVRRSGVSEAAAGLQGAGLIRYRRGNVTIIDRPGLEKRSCECYGVSKAEFDRLLGERAVPNARVRKRPGGTLNIVDRP
jgi:CRP-like cAMP-binding protein